MKIKRVVNGVEMEFELTDNERMNAYEEQEHIFDIDYIQDMFGKDERFDGMPSDEKASVVDTIAYMYRQKFVGSEDLVDRFELACDALDEYFDEHGFQKGIEEMVKLEDMIGYAGAKEIIAGFQFCGDWEIDDINLTNALQRHYYDDVGIYNDGIREAINKKVNEVLIDKYPEKKFSVDHNGMLFENEEVSGGRYEIEVTIDVVGGNGEELGFKMAGNDLEELQAGILPAVQKICAERGYLDNSIVVGVLIEENGEWLDSDEETFDLSELNIWICSYKDALGYLDNFDNVTDILVPKAWLLEKLKAEGETDIEGWFDEYTADSTDMIARDAVSEGVILSCADKRISCVLGLGESYLNTNDYGKRLAAHMREIYLEEHEHYGSDDVGTEFIEHRVANVEEAAGWCLLTYGDRALSEIQHEWIEGDKQTEVCGVDINEVVAVLERCIVPEKDNSLTARLAEATEKSEQLTDSKQAINLDEYEYISNVDGYSTFRKIVPDGNGGIKGIWAARHQDGGEAFEISYEQARGFEPIEDSPIKRLSRQLGEMLLP